MTGLFASLAAFAFAQAAPLSIPPMAAVEKGAFQTADRDGKVLWSAAWTNEKMTVDGRPVMRFTETGRGRHGNFKEEVTWEIEGLYSIDKFFSPVRIERVVRTLDGRVLEKMTKSFDSKRGTASVERTDEKGRVKTKSFDFPSDTIATEGIGTLLRALPFGKPAELHLLTGEPHLYRITMEPEGRESVSTPAGTFDCYKVRLVPDLGALNLFHAFVPKTTFWFEAEPPHRWVRY